MADSRGTEWRTRLRCPSRATPRAVLLTSSLMVLDSLPPMPVLALLSALLRVSLAFTSTGMKPSSLLQAPHSSRTLFDLSQMTSQIRVSIRTPDSELMLFSFSLVRKGGSYNRRKGPTAVYGRGADSPGHNCSRGCLANPWWTSQHEGLLAEVLGLAASLRLDFNLLTFQVYPVPVLQPPVLGL